MQIFDDLNAAGKTLILITHDEGMSERTTRTIRLRDGHIEVDTGSPSLKKLTEVKATAT